MASTPTTTTPTTTVRRAGVADQHDVGHTIGLAFYDDPSMRWMVPDQQRRAAVSTPVFELYASAYVPLGETWVTSDGRAAALWAPAGTTPVPEDREEEFAGRALAILGPEATERLGLLEATFAEHLPAAPHWHLQLLGTEPGHQGRGLGSLLLRAVLERLDREGAAAYLEATTERNRALYERHGFVATGTLTVPEGGPTMTTMWRDPA